MDPTTRTRQLRDSAIVIALALVSAGVIFGLLYDLLDSALRRWSERDLIRHASLIAASVAAQAEDPPRLQRALDALASTDDALALRTCVSVRDLASAGNGAGVRCSTPLAQRAVAAAGKAVRGTIDGHNVVVTAHALTRGATLLVVQDRTFVDARRRHFLRLLFIAATLALLAFLLVARLGRRRAAEEIRVIEPVPTESGAARLRALASAEVANGGLVVLANREPYAHEWGSDGSVVVQRPASGLVTGIEPILRACGGTWIAHAGGSADRAHSDRQGRVAVPPEAPEYTLRRLFIGEDEYDRYYSGLANEGLWPLCHMAHAQPSFRAADWIAYQAVNETFARAALEETPASGLLLVQDYHFALVPRLVRAQAPHIVTSLFWHIPWPHAEIIGICPWKETLLEGMIGADVVGFHTTQYCLNFLDTVQRYLECRVDRDDMSISYGGHRTLVRPYPISVEWPYPAAPRFAAAALRRTLGIADTAHVGLGVDRADYTKGLLERVAAVELLLEQNPSLHGRYTLVQLASPTRSTIRRYRQLVDDLQEAVDRVNGRFGTPSWTPVVLQLRTFSQDEVRQYYAMADSALVTPLHDGMNLVAKEYVASCADGDGALVLSEFAGAAKELDGALLVNPYDTEKTAEAILRAIQMPLAERRARMQAMREQIASSSIYHWSEHLLADMCEVRRSRSRFWPRRSAAAAGNRVTEVAAG